MTRVYLRKRREYTVFKKLTPGERFRFSPSESGPFVKFGRETYEDARRGDDVTQTWTNVGVIRLSKVGIQPN